VRLTIRQNGSHRQHTALPHSLRHSADLSLTIFCVLITTMLHESRTKADLLAPRYFWQWVIIHLTGLRELHCSRHALHSLHSGQHTYSATGFNTAKLCIFPTERFYEGRRKCAICNVKLKFTLLHVMKAGRGVEVQLYYSFNLGDRRGGWSTLRPGRFSAETQTRCPLYRGLGWPQGRSKRVLKISPPLGFDPRAVELTASRYTD